MIVKRILRIVSYVLLGLLALLAIVFAFIELRSLFAGDYQLMNNPKIAFTGYLFRGLFYLSMLIFILCLVMLFVMKKEPSFPHYTVGIVMLLSSIVTIFFYVNNIFFIPIFMVLLLDAIIILRRFII